MFEDDEGFLEICDIWSKFDFKKFQITWHPFESLGVDGLLETSGLAFGDLFKVRGRMKYIVA